MSLIVNSPAKLNLFLHITNRRADGYHLLQSIFHLIELSDQIKFTTNTTGSVSIETDCQTQLTDSPEDNLIYKAALALKNYSRNTQLGCHISLTKNLPVGAGIGGGSSNAATTLLALNHLWQLELPLTTLLDIGIRLGADVPVFIKGHSAWVEGIGEHIQPLTQNQSQNMLEGNEYVCLLTPKVHISTAELFQHPKLQRNIPSYTLNDLYNTPDKFINVFEPIVTQQYKDIKDALDYMTGTSPKNSHITPRLTGTGACVFALFKHQEQALTALEQAPCSGFVTKMMLNSPLRQLTYK